MPEPLSKYDAVIVGGGPAGLSAALILGRCRRRVLLCDAGEQRNRWSHAMHGYLTRDGVPPAEFLKIGYAEVSRYGVEVRRCSVRDARPEKDRFMVQLQDDSWVSARKLLVATGVSDELPEISNIKEFYGKTVHHCPYCDGWENRDTAVAVYSRTPGLAFALKTWTSDLILFTDGPARISSADREKLARFRIPVRKERITHLEGEEGRMEAVVLSSGEKIRRRAMFFSTAQHQACDLAQGLGCVLNHRGTFNTNKLEMSNIPGVYVAGDASRDVQLVIVAAAEGAKAAFAINKALQEEDGLTRSSN